jgi:hypothetical protein
MRKLFLLHWHWFALLVDWADKRNSFFKAEITTETWIRFILNRIMERKLKDFNWYRCFKDSFTVEEGFYMLFDGKEYTQLFLKTDTI